MPRLLMSLLILGLGVPLAAAPTTNQIAGRPGRKALERSSRSSARPRKIHGASQGVGRSRQEERLAAETGPIRRRPRPAVLASLPRTRRKAPRRRGGVSGDLRGPQYQRRPHGKSGVWSKAMTLLKDHYATKPEIKPLLRPLGRPTTRAAESLHPRGDRQESRSKTSGRRVSVAGRRP